MRRLLAIALLSTACQTAHDHAAVDEKTKEQIASFAKDRGLSQDPDSIKLLAGGFSGAAIYRLDYGDDSYVLRLMPNADDAQRQTTLARAAAKAGVGPKVYYVDVDEGAMVTDFVQGRTVHPRDFQDAELVAGFARLLKKLHSSTEDFPSVGSPPERFFFRLKLAQEKGIDLPSDWPFAVQTMALLRDLLEVTSSGEGPAHLDMNSLNIMLDDERFTLIDWADGGVADPVYDIASFIRFECLSPKATQAVPAGLLRAAADAARTRQGARHAADRPAALRTSHVALRYRALRNRDT